MDFSHIVPGLKGEATEKVTPERSAAALKSGTLPVYATPAMTALMERAAAELLESLLSEEFTSVGTLLNVKHTAPTPLGLKIKAKAEILAVEGRKITFAVTAEDERETIGSGVHERFIVDKAKFMSKATAKSQ